MITTAFKFLAVLLIVSGCNSVESGQVWEEKLTRKRVEIGYTGTCYRVGKFYKEQFIPDMYLVVESYSNSTGQCVAYKDGIHPILRKYNVNKETIRIIEKQELLNDFTKI